jgi:hypothetical protein
MVPDLGQEKEKAGTRYSNTEGLTVKICHCPYYSHPVWHSCLAVSFINHRTNLLVLQLDLFQCGSTPIQSCLLHNLATGVPDLSSTCKQLTKPLKTNWQRRTEPNAVMQYHPKHHIQPDLKEGKSSPHAPQHQQWLVSA